MTAHAAILFSVLSPPSLDKKGTAVAVPFLSKGPLLPYKQLWQVRAMTSS